MMTLDNLREYMTVEELLDAIIAQMSTAEDKAAAEYIFRCYGIEFEEEF